MGGVSIPPPRLLETNHFEDSGWVETYAMDQWLDHLESMAHVLAQRRMTSDQRDRLYGLLERIYTDARGRGRPRRARRAA